MNTDKETKMKKLEEFNNLLLKLRSQLDGLHALGLNDLERGILQDVYPHINHIRCDLDRLFYPVDILPEHEIKQNAHGSIRR